MKTFICTFKSNNKASNDILFASAYASSMKQIREQVQGRLSPFYGYHLSTIQISSIDISLSKYKIIPGFEKQ